MILDLVVIGILLVSAGIAFMRGFVREILTIGALLGAALATYMFGPGFVPTVRGWLIDPTATEPQTLFGLIPYEMLAPVIAFALVFTVVIIALTIVAHIVSKGVHMAGLGPVDRSLGVVFGLIRGTILIGFMGLVLNFVLSDEQRETYFSDSKTYAYVDYTAQLMHALIPSRDMIDKVRGKKDNSVAQTGKEPLEPGQNARASGAQNRSVSFEGIQRKAIEAAVQPEIDKLKKTFND